MYSISIEHSWLNLWTRLALLTAEAGATTVEEAVAGEIVVTATAFAVVEVAAVVAGVGRGFQPLRSS